MPQLQDIHLDEALTHVSIAYRNEDFIADRIAPRVAVRRQTDRYYIHNAQREWMRPSIDTRAPGAESQELDFSLSTDNYFCDDHALAAYVPDEERDNADTAILPDIDRVEYLTERLLLNREVHLAARLASHTSIPETNVAADLPWDDPASQPLVTLSQAANTISAAVQRRPNTLLLAPQVFEALRHHPTIVDRLKYTQASAIGAQALAALLDVDQVLVGRASVNTAAEGKPAVTAPVWGLHAYLLHVPSRPGLRTLAGAYTFVWAGTRGAQASGLAVERWREPRRKADGLRVQMYYDHKITAPQAIHRLVNCIQAG
jgi:hypothetical protein